MGWLKHGANRRIIISDQISFLVQLRQLMRTGPRNSRQFWLQQLYRNCTNHHSPGDTVPSIQRQFACHLLENNKAQCDYLGSQGGQNSSLWSSGLWGSGIFWCLPSFQRSMRPPSSGRSIIDLRRTFRWSGQNITLHDFLQSLETNTGKVLHIIRRTQYKKKLQRLVRHPARMGHHQRKDNIKMYLDRRGMDSSDWELGSMTSYFFFEHGNQSVFH